MQVFTVMLKPVTCLQYTLHWHCLFLHSSTGESPVLVWSQASRFIKDRIHWSTTDRIYYSTQARGTLMQGWPRAHWTVNSRAIHIRKATSQAEAVQAQAEGFRKDSSCFSPNRSDCSGAPRWVHQEQEVGQGQRIPTGLWGNPAARRYHCLQGILL